jgi:hypothetical protein
LRLATIDADDFEAAIEEQPVPGTTILAQMGRKERQAERGDKIDTFAIDFLAMDQTRCSGTNPLHKIPPGSPEMPKSLVPVPERTFPRNNPPANVG